MTDTTEPQPIKTDQINMTIQAPHVKFDLIDFVADECINEQFQITANVSTYEKSISHSKFIDCEAQITVHADGTSPRYFHGIITEIERGESGNHRTFWQLKLQPSISRITHTRDCRIWQQMSVVEIASEIFEEFTINNHEWHIGDLHPKRDYTTQFNESHYEFIKRILAEEGIFYYCRHNESGHQIIFTDIPQAAPLTHPTPILEYNSRPGGYKRCFFISKFKQQVRLRSNSYALSDYNHEHPNMRMGSTLSAPRSDATDNQISYEAFEYPGRYKSPAEAGNNYVRYRLNATRSDASTGSGTSNCYFISPGHHFDLTDHDDEYANLRHFITRAKHSGRQHSVLLEEAGEEGTSYSVEFETIPVPQIYRPKSRTKPECAGPMIATISGPENEEIYTDEMGRCKVQFSWDRYGQSDQYSSCWLRVAQSWAGAGWGHMAIPRIGQEVLVSFVDGDIDRPIITGSAYNATHHPPYSLPEHKTKMVLRSDSHKAKGYNEISFEDEPGEEQVYIRSEKSIVQMYGKESVSIQTNGDIDEGVVDVAVQQTAVAALGFLFGNLVPGSSAIIGMATEQLTRAQSEIIKRRK